MATTPTYPVSASGYYKVTLNKSFELDGFTYIPGRNTVVNQAVLDAMTAADGVIASVVAAD